MIESAIKIILASQSPRRQDLLRKAGFDFEVHTQNIEEVFPDEMEPEAVPLFLAQLKAKSFENLADDEMLITADTVVLLKRKLIGKPKDLQEAQTLLEELSGKMHEVITGIHLRYKGREHSFSEVTRVYFRKLSIEDIQYYLKTQAPLDKAGAYGIQDWIGLIGVEKIEGCFYNVMGLPVSRLYQEIQRLLNSF
jgi:septum formation protein